MLEILQANASLISTTIIALSSLGAFVMFSHRTMSTPKKRAFELIDRYHSDPDFHFALMRYKNASNKLDTEQLRKFDWEKVYNLELDDQTNEYLSHIFYIIDLYNYWAMLMFKGDVHQATFREYLASIVVDELNQASELMDILDPDKTEFQNARKLSNWWYKTKRKGDMDIIRSDRN